MQSTEPGSWSHLYLVSQQATTVSYKHSSRLSLLSTKAVVYLLGPQGITTHWQVPKYSACWQRHQQLAMLHEHGTAETGTCHLGIWITSNIYSRDHIPPWNIAVSVQNNPTGRKRQNNSSKPCPALSSKLDDLRPCLRQIDRHVRSSSSLRVQMRTPLWTV